MDIKKYSLYTILYYTTLIVNVVALVLGLLSGILGGGWEWTTLRLEMSILFALSIAYGYGFERGSGL